MTSSERQLPLGEEISDWENWSPSDYLKDYYSEVEPDEVETISFLVASLGQVGNVSRALVFGVGPTLHHVFPVVPHADQIDLADYIQANLDEVRVWLDSRQGRHSWAPFVKYTLECEGQEADDAQILLRKLETRKKLGKLLPGDAGLIDPLGKEARGAYPLVLSLYCADSATGDSQVWERYMRNIATLVAPGGTFITAALRAASFYRVGSRFFPSANINESDLARVLAFDFDQESTNMEVRELMEHRNQGYSGIILASAIKR